MSIVKKIEERRTTKKNKCGGKKGLPQREDFLKRKKTSGRSYNGKEIVCLFSKRECFSNAFLKEKTVWKVVKRSKDQWCSEERILLGRRLVKRKETRKFLKQIHAKKLSIVKKSKCGGKKDFRGEISSRERRPQ